MTWLKALCNYLGNIYFDDERFYCTSIKALFKIDAFMHHNAVTTKENNSFSEHNKYGTKTA